MHAMRQQPAAPAPRLPDHRHEIPWPDLAGWPLPHLERGLDRVLARSAAALAHRQIRSLVGWDLIAGQAGPFVLVANHGSRREAVYLPALLMLARGGRPVHFLADWSFQLIPGVGYLYRHAGAISVTRKPARPRVLNRLKPWFEGGDPPMAQARRLLEAGAPVGIFPEGTVNRDATALLRGRFGAARLSLEAGVPVLPVGIRFERARGRLVDTSGPMSLHVGAPLPPPAAAPPELAAVRAWHARIMTALAGLCGKDWPHGQPSEDPAS